MDSRSRSGMTRGADSREVYPSAGQRHRSPIELRTCPDRGARACPDKGMTGGLQF